MNEIKIFSNPSFGNIRIITDDASGELLFCANDVTAALEYANGRKAVADHVDEGDVTKRDTPIPNQYGALVNQPVTYITESGVYSLIFGSKQERAKEFKRWVTSEVLPSIRKTGQYSVNQAPLSERLQANLAFADWTIKTLNLNEASKIAWVKKISDKFGLAAAYPTYVNAGTEHPILHSASDLLKEHRVGISAQAFNKILERKGVVKQAERKGKNGKLIHWMVLQSGFDKYGQNQQHKDHQQNSQIEWYDNLFPELLEKVGLAKQQSLGL